MQGGGGESGQAGELDPVSQVGRCHGYPGGVEVGGQVAGEVADGCRTSAEQRQGTRSVATPGMSESDRQLGQPFPQCPLLSRCGLPLRLKHLVGMKRAAFVDQSLGRTQPLPG